MFKEMNRRGRERLIHIPSRLTESERQERLEWCWGCGGRSMPWGGSDNEKRKGYYLLRPLCYLKRYLTSDMVVEWMLKSKWCLDLNGFVSQFNLVPQVHFSELKSLGNAHYLFTVRAFEKRWFVSAPGSWSLIFLPSCLCRKFQWKGKPMDRGLWKAA